MNKVIHYCWFGNNPLGVKEQKCIASWKKFFPDFEIKEWNETNFDVKCNAYVEQAYNNKKYAFVSDYVRFEILHKYGGLYFDTDVEVVKPMYDLLENYAFAGFETQTQVAPGLVVWAKEPENEVFAKMLSFYDNMNFVNEDGSLNMITVCNYFTDILKQYGLVQNNTYQVLDNGFVIYPNEYFCPYNNETGVMNKPEKTYSIHWYAMSWLPKKQLYISKITRIIHKYFGVNSLKWLNKLLKRKS